jgi:hypothetical protein
MADRNPDCTADMSVSVPYLSVTRWVRFSEANA